MSIDFSLNATLIRARAHTPFIDENLIYFSAHMTQHDNELSREDIARTPIEM